MINSLVKTAFTAGTKHAVPIYKAAHLLDEQVEQVLKSKKFQDYVSKAELSNTRHDFIKLNSIELLGVEMFGKNVGFINLRANTTFEQIKLPSYVFLRGGAVAILVLLNHNKMLLVKQYRVPVQQFMLEAPAGMLDESGDFTGVAAKEIEEETGIKLESKNLISLGSYMPSVGGSDEEIYMFLTEVDIPQEQLDKLLAKTHGEDEHERINIEVQDYNIKNVLATRDSKLIALALAHQDHKSKNSKL